LAPLRPVRGVGGGDGVLHHEVHVHLVRVGVRVRVRVGLG